MHIYLAHRARAEGGFNRPEVGRMTARNDIARSPEWRDLEPPVLDGPINGDRFEACVTQVWVPEFRPGDIVVMHSLSSHERLDLTEKIETLSATLRFLPPYSPGFNPIEKALSRLKAMLRKAGKRRSAASGTSSARSSTSSSQTRAPNTSDHTDMKRNERKAL
jgi:transposase